MRMKIAVVVAAVMMCGVAALAQSVTYDYDKSVDFTTFKTYAWARGTDLSDELNHKRVVGAIDNQLTLKGLARMPDKSQADVLVAYHASFDRNFEITGSSSGWGPYGLNGRFGSARVGQVLVGTVVVEIKDAHTRDIVWRASATTDINPTMSPENREKSINKAAEKLFKNYPPKRN